MLKHKYHTLIAAWALGLDRFASGSLGFVGFCKACRGMGWEKDLKPLWKALDKDNSGTITLEEVDPVSFKPLMALRTHLEMCFGCVSDAWHGLSGGLSKE